MPSLPRIKRPRSRTRPEETVVPARREPAELSANGLVWIHLDAPDPEVATELAERIGWHPLDVEDVLSKRQRPKIDEYPEYIFGVLHFPFYDKAVQRLNAAELDFFLGQGYLVTLPTVELLPVSRLFQRCVDDAELRESLFSKGSGYLLYHVLDDLFDYCFPILDKIGFKLDSIEDDVLEGRSEEAVRDISNAKQEIISYRKIIKPQRRALHAPGAGAVLRRSRRRVRAHLGPAGQLQGSRRGARVNQRAGAFAPVQRRPTDPHRLQHRLPAGDADREPLGHERRASGRRQPGDRLDS